MLAKDVLEQNPSNQSLVTSLQETLTKKPVLLWLDSNKYPLEEIQTALKSIAAPCSFRHWEPLQGQLPCDGEQEKFSFEKETEDVGTEFINYLLNLGFERSREQRIVWIPLLETLLMIEKDKRTALYLHGFLEESDLGSIVIVAPTKDTINLQQELGFLSEHKNCQVLA